MIARLRGRLLEKTPEQIVIDAGGVGYQLSVSLNCFYRLPAVGAELDVRVHTHVREDALQLYGFLDDAERSLFLLLIQVSGIGPRVAVSILSGMETADLEDALSAGDVRRLVAVPGIGKKKAELMILQLKDKARVLVQGRDARTDTPTVPRGSDGAEAVSALVNLGYREAEAEHAVAGIEERGTVPLPDLIREALRRLAS
jgi:Holliday junction DNA helicase RuvA